MNKSINIPSSVSTGLSDLLRRMLEKNSAARIPLNEIKEHHWVTKYAFDSVFERLQIISNQIPSDEQILSEIEKLVGHSVDVNSSSFLLMKREKIVEVMSYSKTSSQKNSLGSDSHLLSPMGFLGRFSLGDD
jgi:serine/threonine protein kinase